MDLCHIDVHQRVYIRCDVQEALVMNAPLYEYGLFGVGASLVMAVIIGFFFGMFLGRGGLGNPHKLTGVFYLRDFTVPKVMFTAMIVAASGLYLLSDLKLMDIGRVWIVPTFFWPQIAGGFLFGLGFLVAGYCPGTAVAGLGSGRLDALVVMFGMVAGSLLFAGVFPSLEKFYLSSKMGTVTLPQVIGINHWLIIFFLVIFAGIMFYFMERFERKLS
jgi:uncharacterized membrane protein YedE/YeeE